METIITIIAILLIILSFYLIHVITKVQKQYNEVKIHELVYAKMLLHLEKDGVNIQQLFDKSKREFEEEQEEDENFIS